MESKIISLPAIEIIGKEGLCTPEVNVVKNLWKETNENFNQVASLAMKEKDGSLVGLWGAMSDETMSFLPWTDNFSRGYYLAGVEVNHGSEPPAGWKKWTLPARKYFVVEVDMEHYSEIFTDVIQNQLPQNNLKLCGAVCDHTKPSAGQNFLFFPVE